MQIRSKVKAQGQISIPACIQRKLGIGPGSVLEWAEEGDKVVVRRAAQFSLADIHQAVFPEGTPKARTTDEMREGIRQYVQKRYAQH